METIHIVTASNDCYSKPLAVMLNSLLENKVTKNKLNIYIINSNISEQNKLKLTNSMKKFKQKIKFLKVDPLIYAGFMTRGYLTMETYYRISIPELLNKDIDKVIYLDSDLIVKKDITSLWNINVDKYYLAAVTTPAGNTRYKDLSIPIESNYFNAGVLLINLKRWRENNVSEKIIQFINNNASKIKFCSQDPLNAILHDKWLQLDPRWNYLAPYRRDVEDPYIIHYNGEGKPWNHNHRFKGEYLKYLKTTIWDD
ncbi:glycosyltransferase family 8 protein [Ammoniphilus sp. 3BR4]|uniref:glycosyltransferase family 8 protein n=1 Tax=Ammoniphilus sp. 3BR4 TaxID=3158265 RepID=UPI0034667618